MCVVSAERVAPWQSAEGSAQSSCSLVDHSASDEGEPAIEEEVEQVETEGVDLTEGCEAPPA